MQFNFSGLQYSYYCNCGRVQENSAQQNKAPGNAQVGKNNYLHIWFRPVTQNVVNVTHVIDGNK